MILQLFKTADDEIITCCSLAGVVAGLLLSALSSQISPASSAAAFSGFEVGGSTCIGAGSACTGEPGAAAGFSAAGCAGAGSTGSHEGVKAGALTLGTKAGAPTLSWLAGMATVTSWWHDLTGIQYGRMLKLSPVAPWKPAFDPQVMQSLTYWTIQGGETFKNIQFLTKKTKIAS